MAAACNVTSTPCASQSLSHGLRCHNVGKQVEVSHGGQIGRKFAFGSAELHVRRRGGTQCRPPKRNVERLTALCAMDVPDFLPARKVSCPTKPVGPSFDLTPEGAIIRQLDALQINDQPYPDHGVEVMYRFAEFDPFRRSSYFGRAFDLGQFERFRRIFHHSTYRVLLGHNDREILSSLFVDEHCFKQRVWIKGARPGEEETFEFTLVQRVGGVWDGYWLTNSVRHDGEGITGSIAY